MKKKNYKIIIIMCIMLIALSVIAVVLISKKNNSSEEQEYLSTVEQQIEDESAFEIKTKYCNLYYPAKWEKQICIEENDNDEIYEVCFFASLNNKQYHLFDIVFGESGNVVGFYNENGQEIPLSIRSGEFENTDELSDDEEIMLFTMQEDINYLLGMLQKEKNFSMDK